MIAAGIAWMLADCEPEERRLCKLFDTFADENVVYHPAKLMDDKEAMKNRSARAALAAILQMPDVTRGGVISTVQAHLRLFDSDMMRRLTDTSTLDVDALIEGRPMSLYIMIQPDRLSAYRSVLRLWLSGLLLASRSGRKCRSTER